MSTKLIGTDPPDCDLCERRWNKSRTATRRLEIMGRPFAMACDGHAQELLEVWDSALL
jgi:hypothetical protein